MCLSYLNSRICSTCYVRQFMKPGRLCHAMVLPQGIVDEVQVPPKLVVVQLPEDLRKGQAPNTERKPLDRSTFHHAAKQPGFLRQVAWACNAMNGRCCAICACRGHGSTQPAKQHLQHTPSSIIAQGLTFQDAAPKQPKPFSVFPSPVWTCGVSATLSTQKATATSGAQVDTPECTHSRKTKTHARLGMIS